MTHPLNVATAASPSDATSKAHPPWWSEAVGYQVYIRSFADSDGDGVGDLQGIHDRLDHLAWLGVGVVWITPFYPSPMHDHGYDVADYVGIEPVFGDLADLDMVVAKAHRLGIKVIIDLVPNHTSSTHRWFAEARSSKDSPYRDYYLWRDSAPDGGPPNNWLSHFGGPAWTLDQASGQYWCHLFLPEQPDLNWRNPAVREEFDRILEFWLDRGVDGFRIDVAHALLKDPDFPDLPPVDGAPAEGHLGDAPASPFDALQHIYDVDQDDVPDIYRRWRKITAPRDAVLLGELYILDAARFRRYFADDDGLNLGFWFKPLHVRWHSDDLREALREGTGGSGVSWVQNSHDRSRAVTRFGGGEIGRARQLALATLLMGLPGTPFVYQGEELGLADGEVPRDRWADPAARNTGQAAFSRDGARTPMLWEPGAGWGFTAADDAWLPFGDRRPEDTVAVQRDDEGSMLHRYRALIALRAATPDLRSGALVWLTDSGPVVAYRRGDVVVAANTGEADAALALPDGDWRVAFATDRGREGDAPTATITLAPAEAVILP